MLEANGRGFWNPNDDVLDRIKEQYANVDDEIELGSGKFLNVEQQQQQQQQQQQRSSASSSSISDSSVSQQPQRREYSKK
jgi:cobalamin biosynthesis Mg chelatase CobN